MGKVENYSFLKIKLFLISLTMTICIPGFGLNLWFQYQMMFLQELQLKVSNVLKH